MDKHVTLVLNNRGCGACGCNQQVKRTKLKQNKDETQTVNKIIIKGNESDEAAQPEENKPIDDEIYSYIDNKMQEQYDIIIKFIEMHVRVINTRIDDVVKDVANLMKARNYQEYIFETKMKKLDGKIEEIEYALKQMESNNNTMYSDDSALIRDIKMKLMELEDRIIGSNDLIFEGVQENSEDEEDWDESENKVRQIMKHNLDMADGDEIMIERAHRIGERNEDGQPRCIIVQFSNFKDKEAILKKASELKNGGIYINGGYLEESMQKKSGLYPVLKRYRAQGKYAVIKFDKMLVKESMN